MAFWITTMISMSILLLGYSASGESIEELELPQSDEAKGLSGFEGLGDEGHEHQHELKGIVHHGGHKPATSFQSFYLESKNPVPVVFKKEHEQHHFLPEETYGHFDKSPVHIGLPDFGHEDSNLHLQQEEHES